MAGLGFPESMDVVTVAAEEKQSQGGVQTELAGDGMREGLGELVSEEISEEDNVENVNDDITIHNNDNDSITIHINGNENNGNIGIAEETPLIQLFYEGVKYSCEVCEYQGIRLCDLVDHKNKEHTDEERI